jgi:DNA modification methylase
MIDNNILSNIDWDFKTAKTNSAMHAIHPYPAKFIPQIPNVFINEFSKIGDTVYDPFLGSGIIQKKMG